MPRKENSGMPTIISQILYTDDPASGIRIDSPEWSAWLEDATQFYFRFRDNDGFSVRKQAHRQGQFWYAHKRVSGRLRKLYIGARESVTYDRLVEISGRFMALKGSARPGAS